jgi:hypothetical protein
MEDKKYKDIAPELWDKLRVGFVAKEKYIIGITSIPRPAHDVFPLFKYDGKEGILLIKRKVEPAKGIIWCLGGGQKRGFPIRESLNNLIREESHLELYDVLCLNNEPEDLFWDKDPFGHGKGVHDSATAYFAKARGKLNLDTNHFDPLIIAPSVFEEIKNTLHWYVRKYTEKALNLAFNK